MVSAESSQILMKGLIEDGGGILESLGKSSPSQLPCHPRVWVSPFESKDVLAGRVQPQAEEGIL